jgi:Lar family restriction alleviation protein
MFEKLKPCPFCGSENIRLYGGNFLGDHCGVVCEDCGAQSKTNILLVKGEEKAIEAWNRRVGEESR